MFEILKLLRDLNVLRAVRWEVVARPGDHMSDLVVHIPVSESDVLFIEDMERLFAPAEEQT